MKRKFIFILLSMLLLFCVSCSTSDNTARKPSVMYGGKLYILSPDKVGTYKFENNENLILVGTINDSIDGTKFAEKDMQVSGNADLVKCDVFTSEEFPDYIFVYNNGNYVAFIKN